MRIEGNLNSLLGIHKLDQADVQRLAKSGQSAPAQAVGKSADRASLQTQVRLFEASARVIQDSATTVKIVDRAMAGIDERLVQMQDAAKTDSVENLKASFAGIKELEAHLDTDGSVLPSLGRPDWNSSSVSAALEKGDRAEIMLALSESRDQLASARNWASEAKNSAIQNGLLFLNDHVRQLGSDDQAKELADFTKIQILRQSGMALIAQAQIAPQAALGSLA